MKIWIITVDIFVLIFLYEILCLKLFSETIIIDQLIMKNMFFEMKLVSKFDKKLLCMYKFKNIVLYSKKSIFCQNWLF